MKASEIQEYDTVRLDDGRIGIVIEIASNGNMMLEKRQKDFEKDSFGNSPIINTNASQVEQIIHESAN
ncbi:hypothetical protein [Levilactobacillus senmaizukei]|uniref:hypothetical protein n=1 Tax=Levilactobacillus senmaizukei TaxID=431273 RepID=UPI00077BD9B4|nr:hypothetical protein [Levilactobacillus senmaizukei]